MNSGIDQITKRLRMHAGLPRSFLESEDLSTSVWYLEKCNFNPEKLTPVIEMVNDVLALLDLLNSHLLILRQDAQYSALTTSVQIVYSMSGIIFTLARTLSNAQRMGASFDVQKILSDALFCTAFCWDQTLAGDIEDLKLEFEAFKHIEAIIDDRFRVGEAKVPGEERERKGDRKEKARKEKGTGPNGT